MGRSGQSGLARAAASVKRAKSAGDRRAARECGHDVVLPSGAFMTISASSASTPCAHSIDRHRVEIDLLNVRPRREQQADPLHDRGQRRHVARRLAAHAAQQRRTAELSDLVADLVEIEAHRQYPNVMERFGPDPAETDERHRPPIAVAARADDHLEAARGHGLDQNAVDGETGMSRSDLLQLRPGVRELRVVADVEQHSAGVALVRQRGGLKLERDRKPDGNRGFLGIQEIADQPAAWNLDSELGDIRLARVFGEHRCARFSARSRAAATSAPWSRACARVAARGHGGQPRQRAQRAFGRAKERDPGRARV